MSRRILYLSFNMPWRGGGTWYRALGFARQLAQRGHDVTLMATDLDARRGISEETIDGVTVVTTPALLQGKLRTGWDPYEIGRRLRWLRGRRFDIVHGFESRPVVIYPALQAQRQGATLFLDWCDWFGRGGSVETRRWPLRPLLRPVETFYEEHFRTRAAGTTTINDVLRRRAVALGVPEARIHRLPNGAEREKIRPLPRAAARTARGLDEEGPLIGHLGQAFPADAALMAAAFNRVRETQPAARLVLIGSHKTDIAGHFADPQALVQTGFTMGESLNEWLAACDLLWLPLRDTLANRGRWPFKLSDYLSAGRPTVATTVGEWQRLFSGEEPAGLLAPDDPAAFAAATLRLLDDPALSTRLGHNARRKVEQELAWEKVTDGLEKFYEKWEVRSEK